MNFGCLALPGIPRDTSNRSTNLNAGLQTSFTELINNGVADVDKYVIFLTDGAGTYSTNILIPAIENNITVHTIGLGNGVSDSTLRSIAELTGGNYYFASADTELEDLYDQIGDDTLGALSKVRLCNGAISVVNLDDPNADTDEDGLTDLEELGSLSNDNKGRQCYHFTSYPDEIDSDRDGYSDGDDLYPLIPYKTPIVLIHGLTDNTENIFGAETNISSANDHYIMDNINADKTINRSRTLTDDGIDYYDYNSHEIEKITQGDNSNKEPQMLAYKLEDKLRYIRNENLFAVNYPNKDFNWKNADIVKWYIEEHLTEMKCLYPTKQTYQNRDLKVNLIGHSNARLVSRYYIESLDGSKHVSKLITLNTPHWGSGTARASTNHPFPTWGTLETSPLHLDLKTDGMHFGGYKTHRNFVKDGKKEYMNNYQSQLGITYKDFGNGKNKNTKSHSMLIDTITGHNPNNSLHVEAPKRSEAIRQVIYYLHE